MTQTARVERLLRQRGEHGVTTADFKASPTADGGAPIERLAARIEELRSAGHDIPKGLKRGKVALYVLRPAAAPSARPVPALTAAPPVDVTPAEPTHQLFAA